MRKYKRIKIRVGGNRKTEGNILDTVRGCGAGRHNDGKGCYGSCYAAKMARMAGVDFSQPVSMGLDREVLENSLKKVEQNWIRIGVSGDPCWDWELTVAVAKICAAAGKVPVVITKAWVKASVEIIEGLVRAGTVLHISMSALDRRKLVDNRANFATRYRDCGGRVVIRLISAQFGKVGDLSKEYQNDIVNWATKRNRYKLLETPLRTFSNNPLIKAGTIIRRELKAHVSVISNQLDGQLTGGRLFSGHRVFHCDTACKDCENQCCTVGVDAKNQA